MLSLVPPSSKTSPASGLAAIEPPPRRVRRSRWTDDQIATAIKVLRSGRSVTDFRAGKPVGRPSSSSAKWRAESLKLALIAAGIPRAQLRTRTWSQGSRYFWAVRREPPKRKKGA